MEKETKRDGGQIQKEEGEGDGGTGRQTQIQKERERQRFLLMWYYVTSKKEIIHSQPDRQTNRQIWRGPVRPAKKGLLRQAGK